ncbi:MAG: hypothetical protein QXW71_05935 [Thermoplasmata archaeon]
MSDNEKRIVINSIEDALIALEEVDKFLSNYRKALDKLKNITRKLSTIEQKPIFYSFQTSKNMDKVLEELFNKFLEEKLLSKQQNAQTGLTTEEEKEIDNEIEKVLNKLKENNV